MTQTTIAQRTYKKALELVVRNICPFWIMLSSFAFSDAIKLDYVDVTDNETPLF